MTTMRSEMVKCGKKGCKKCPHGPYLYEYYRVGKKLKKMYIGKVLKPVEVSDPEADLLLVTGQAPRWYCLELLDGLESDSFSVLRRKYRQKVTVCCPHHGNYDERKYRLLRAAWNVLRQGRR